MAIDKTTIDIDGSEHYIWAAADCDILEVLTIEGLPGRSSLNALLFLKDVLERFHDHSLARTDRGLWYDWSLVPLECEYERETLEFDLSSKSDSVFE